MTPRFYTLLTGKDNQSYDLGRVLWALGCIAFIGYEGYIVVKTVAFDLMTFAGGLSAIFTSGASSLHFKRGTEPDAIPEPVKTPPQH